MFLQEDVTRVIDQEQAVDHLNCNNELVVVSGSGEDNVVRKQQTGIRSIDFLTNAQIKIINI